MSQPILSNKLHEHFFKFYLIIKLLRNEKKNDFRNWSESESR